MTQSTNSLGQPVNASVFTSVALQDTSLPDGGFIIQVNMNETEAAQLTNLDLLLDGSLLSNDQISSINNGGRK